jgi:hypothetical protein
MSFGDPKLLHPAVNDIFPKHWRRRSADVGGLNLATGSGDHGQGWMGYTGALE